MDGDDFCEFIMSYFSPTAFSGFGVDRRGFYSVYTEAFEEILKREKYISKIAIYVLISRKVDKTTSYPSFGSPTSSFEDVLRFYSSWLAFSTRRSFAAADQYNTREVD